MPVLVRGSPKELSVLGLGPLREHLTVRPSGRRLAQRLAWRLVSLLGLALGLRMAPLLGPRSEPRWSQE